MCLFAFMGMTSETQLQWGQMFYYFPFSGGSMVKNLPASAGDLSFIPGSGRSSGERSGNPLQYSCLGIPWTEEPGRLQSMGSQKSWT